MVLQRIRAFYRQSFETGDRLGEAFYGVWMVVISIGIINSERTVTRELVVSVIVTAFSVNIAWGLIDGITVMLTNIIQRAQLDRLLYDLQTRPSDADARAVARQHLAETAVGSLPSAEIDRIVDALAGQRTAGPDPRKVRYSPTADDWRYALGILAIDVAAVVPLVIPFALTDDPHLAIYLSRLIATVLFALIGATYARNLNRNPWIAGLLLGALGHAVFTGAYQAGW